MPKLEEKDYSYLETGPARGFVSPEFKKEVEESKKLSEIANESPAKPALSESKSPERTQEYLSNKTKEKFSETRDYLELNGEEYLKRLKAAMAKSIQ